MPEAKKEKKQNEPKPVKKNVSFYLIKARKWRTLLKINGVRTEISGENSVINIQATDGNYDVKVAAMRAHKGNKSNGGTEFVELTESDKGLGNECLLDSLLPLAKESLLNVLNDSNPKNRALSRGALMMRILKEKE